MFAHISAFARISAYAHISAFAPVGAPLPLLAALTFRTLRTLCTHHTLRMFHTARTLLTLRTLRTRCTPLGIMRTVPTLPRSAVRRAGNKRKHNALDFDLTEEDWKAFLHGAKQRTYKKGEYVLREGQPTAALFQIVTGSCRVELQIKDQAQAIIVGYRHAGEMFGETSLLKSGVATASIAADEETTIVCLEGSYLEELFQSSPGLPGRFFCFIAAYEAERLYQLTQSAAEAKKPQVTAANSVRLPIADVMNNAAYSGIFRKFLFATEAAERDGSVPKPDPEDHTKHSSVALASFDVVLSVEQMRSQPNAHALLQACFEISDKFLAKKVAPNPHPNNGRPQPSLVAFAPC